MSNVPCRKSITQMVPSGYDYKEVPATCGQTGIHGDPIYCFECREKIINKGHMPYECSHGVDMRPEGTVCSRCEFGD